MLKPNFVKTIDKVQFEQSTIWINVWASRAGTNLSPPMTNIDKGELLIERMGNPPHPFRLHNHFDPLAGGITIWQDRQGGFEVKAEQQGGTLHNKFTFTLPDTDDFKIQVFQDCTKKIDFGLADVDTVRVVGAGGGGPGDNQNPPQMGGKG